MSRAGPVVRRAGPGDAEALTELEQAANLVGLAHIFDPATHPFPTAEVQQRWSGLLADTHVVVETVLEPPAGRRPAAVLAHDEGRVRHLAVRPEVWGRGLARLLLDRAVQRIRAGGCTPALWCLVDNHRARGLYTHLGWQPTGVHAHSDFAPHPAQLEYAFTAAPGRGDGGRS